MPIQVKDAVTGVSQAVKVPDEVLTALLASLGVVGDAAWANGTGSHTALLKAIAANTAASTLGTGTYKSATSAALVDAATVPLYTPSAGKRFIITDIDVCNSHPTVGTAVEIIQGATVLTTLPAAAAFGGAVRNYNIPLVAAVDAVIKARCTVTGSNVKVTVTGYEDG